MCDGGGEGEAAIAETEEIEARWKAVEAYHREMERRWSSLVCALLRNCTHDGSSSDQPPSSLAPAYRAEKIFTMLGHLRCFGHLRRWLAKML